VLDSPSVDSLLSPSATGRLRTFLWITGCTDVAGLRTMGRVYERPTATPERVQSQQKQYSGTMKASHGTRAKGMIQHALRWASCQS